MESKLSGLYEAFDRLYQDILPACANCPDHDCEGYVWLLSDEADRLVEVGVEVVEINEVVNFIHSFPEVDGIIKLDIPKPPCRYRMERLCSIYTHRPLVCRMYPVGILTHEDKAVIALHKDCQFTRQLCGEAKTAFTKRVVAILHGLSAELYQELLETYRQVDAVSSLPAGPNEYEVLGSFER